MVSGLGTVVAGRVGCSSTIIGNFLTLFLGLVILPLLIIIDFVLFGKDVVVFFLLLLFLTLTILVVPNCFSRRPGRTHIVMFFKGCGNAFARAKFF